MTICLRKKRVQFYLPFFRNVHNYILISIIVHSRFFGIILIFIFIRRKFINNCFIIYNELIKVKLSFISLLKELNILKKDSSASINLL